MRQRVVQAKRILVTILEVLLLAGCSLPGDITDITPPLTAVVEPTTTLPGTIEPTHTSTALPTILPTNTLTPTPSAMPTRTPTPTFVPTTTQTPLPTKIMPSPTKKPLPTATMAVSNYDGEWVGTTSQRKLIKLTIVNNTITSFWIEFDPPVCSSTLQVIYEPQPLRANSFEITMMFGATRFFVVNGTIDAQGQMGGTLQAEQNSLCEAITIEWSAKR